MANQGMIAQVIIPISRNKIIIHILLLGTGTIAIFAPRPFVFDVSHDAFPLLTTKKVNFRLIAEELFFFISGSSNVVDLQKKNVHIW